jgi:hypothetical protein
MLKFYFWNTHIPLIKIFGTLKTKSKFISESRWDKGDFYVYPV